MSTSDDSALAILRILIILAVAGAAVFLLIRVPKMIFSKPVEPNQPQCAKDKNYYYKDPKNHPYDC